MTNRLKAADEGLARDSLVGSYVHTLTDDDGQRIVQQQGCVVAEPHPGMYLVEWFSWLIPDSVHQELVSIHDMLDWRFYDDAEWMRNAYDASLPKSRLEFLSLMEVPPQPTS